jgi:hypothetical protein
VTTLFTNFQSKDKVKKRQERKDVYHNLERNFISMMINKFVNVVSLEDIQRISVADLRRNERRTKNRQYMCTAKDSIRKTVPRKIFANGENFSHICGNAENRELYPTIGENFSHICRNAENLELYP